MSFSPKILLVELVMSVDRMIESARKSQIKQDQWSPATVLGHISQVDELVWYERVKLMVEKQALGESEPSFAWWEPDPVATEEKFKDFDVETAGALAMQARTKLVTYLNSLTQDQWDARAVHATFGSINVKELIFQTLTHDEEHRASFV